MVKKGKKMDKLIKRTVTAAAFAFVVFAAMFLCVDKANATIDIHKDGQPLTPGVTYGNFQNAVEAVNNDESIEDGDDIKFIEDGGTYPGNALLLFHSE